MDADAIYRHTDTELVREQKIFRRTNIKITSVIHNRGEHGPDVDTKGD